MNKITKTCTGICYTIFAVISAHALIRAHLVCFREAFFMLYVLSSAYTILIVLNALGVLHFTKGGQYSKPIVQ